MKAYIIYDTKQNKRLAGFVGRNGAFVPERTINRVADINNFMEKYNLTTVTISRNSSFAIMNNLHVSPTTEDILNK